MSLEEENAAFVKLLNGSKSVDILGGPPIELGNPQNNDEQRQKAFLVQFEAELIISREEYLLTEMSLNQQYIEEQNDLILLTTTLLENPMSEEASWDIFQKIRKESLSIWHLYIHRVQLLHEYIAYLREHEKKFNPEEWAKKIAEVEGDLEIAKRNEKDTKFAVNMQYAPPFQNLTKT